MSAIDDLFTKLRADGQKALMPFLTAGDPDLAFTADAIQQLAARGCHLFEVGIPYSDPIADGPVIQASYTRALDGGIKLEEILAALKEVTTNIGAPLVTMVSYAIIYRHGTEAYVEAMKQTGVAGIIAPDLPLDEAEDFARICTNSDLSLIQLVTPTTPRERALRVAETSTGFLYYVSVAGITGERKKLPAELVDTVGWLREQTPLPVCIGFGVSQPEHVRLLGPVADGLIVGSAIVRRMATASERPRDEVLSEIGAYVKSLLAALQ